MSRETNYSHIFLRNVLKQRADKPTQPGNVRLLRHMFFLVRFQHDARSQSHDRILAPICRPCSALGCHMAYNAIFASHQFIPNCRVIFGRFKRNIRPFRLKVFTCSNHPPAVFHQVDAVLVACHPVLSIFCHCRCWMQMLMLVSISVLVSVLDSRSLPLCICFL